MTNDPFADFDGAYVLGALAPQDRSEFEQHLATCDECPASVRSLAPIPAVLRAVPAQEFATELAPPTLLPRLLRELRRARSRRRWITGAVAASVAAGLIAATALFTTPDSPGHPVAMRSVTASSSVHATADVQDVAWGTRIDLRCSYDRVAVYPDGTSYLLVVIDRSGMPHQLGSWKMAPGDEVTTFSAGTALSRADISAVQVTTTTGMKLLDLPL